MAQWLSTMPRRRGLTWVQALAKEFFFLSGLSVPIVYFSRRGPIFSMYLTFVHTSCFIYHFTVAAKWWCASKMKWMRTGEVACWQTVTNDWCCCKRMSMKVHKLLGLKWMVKCFQNNYLSWSFGLLWDGDNSNGGNGFHNLTTLLKQRWCDCEVLLRLTINLFLAVDLALKCMKETIV